MPQPKREPPDGYPSGQESPSVVFGKLLAECRDRAGLSQRQLADAVECDFTYISHLEHARVIPPSARLIQRMARALGADETLLLAAAGKLPHGLVEMLPANPLLHELLTRLATARLPDYTYRVLLNIVEEALELPPAPRTYREAVLAEEPVVFYPLGSSTQDIEASARQPEVAVAKDDGGTHLAESGSPVADC